MLNRWVGCGRLVRDPELRSTAAGKAVASLTLAIDRDYKSEDGEKPTDFVDVVAWGPTASFCQKYLSKGRMVAVDGRLQSRKWTDKEGNKRISWEINAASVYPADSRRQDGAVAPPPAAPGEDYAAIEGDDEDAPF